MNRKSILVFALAFTACLTSCVKEVDTQDEVIEIDGVALNVSQSELAIGDIITLSAKILPDGLDPASIQWDESVKENMFWRTDNPRVATVTQNGLVIAVGKGSCNIQFIFGAFAGKCAVTVRDFDVQALYGQWQDDNANTYYFHYDGTGKADDEAFNWTFDGMRLTITASADSKTFILVSIEPGKLFYYDSNDSTKQTICLKMTSRPITAQDISQGIVQVEGKDGVKYNAVDLGLPGGVLWSTCNVLADTPEQTGGFFAWGETGTKSSYILDNYKWYDNTNLGLTKYKNADNGEFIILEREDDAASIIMGGDWRTPTNQEIVDLCNNCYTVWSKLGDVDGIQFVSMQDNHKGNSIFMPLSGLTDNYYQHITGNDMMIGFYWSSTLSRSDDYAAYYLQLFNKPENELNKCFYADITTKRYNGACIRPVADQ